MMVVIHEWLSKIIICYFRNWDRSLFIFVLVDKSARLLTFNVVAGDELQHLINGNDGEGKFQDHNPLLCGQMGQLEDHLERKRVEVRWSWTPWRKATWTRVSKTKIFSNWMSDSQEEGQHRWSWSAGTWTGSWQRSARSCSMGACAPETDSQTSLKRKKKKRGESRIYLLHEETSFFKNYILLDHIQRSTCWEHCTSQWWPAQTGPWSWEEQPQRFHSPGLQSPRSPRGTAWSVTARIGSKISKCLHLCLVESNRKQRKSLTSW